jgi:hypothetical protein
MLFRILENAFQKMPFGISDNTFQKMLLGEMLFRQYF